METANLASNSKAEPIRMSKERWTKPPFVRNTPPASAKPGAPRAAPSTCPFYQSIEHKFLYQSLCMDKGFKLPYIVPRKAGVDVDMGGFAISEAARILINVWAIRKDPSLCKDPNSFVPEGVPGIGC
ncbi:conserved hypothetical protein [Ricinus communis]|uniref:Uncharacterized protein n=1 Tax=Ricinus communis TaxID=3988 RepID=B9RBW7_RICCO|nr:conserved hypothetical protein [Ricinus communis]